MRFAASVYSGLLLPFGPPPLATAGTPLTQRGDTTTRNLRVIADLGLGGPGVSQFVCFQQVTPCADCCPQP